MNNSEWIKALKVRASDTGWIGVIIMVYGIGIGFIFHCIQRRTLTPIFYVIVPSIISLPILNVFFDSLYMNTDWFTPDYQGFVIFVQLIMSTFLGKLAIRHDKLVALKLLNDANIATKIFNNTELLQQSFALISKDISIILGYGEEEFKEKSGLKFKKLIVDEKQKKMNKKFTNPKIEPKVPTLTQNKNSELKEKLENIKDLLDQNLISEDDYEAMKKKILGL